MKDKPWKVVIRKAQVRCGSHPILLTFDILSEVSNPKNNWHFFQAPCPEYPD